MRSKNIINSSGDAPSPYLTPKFAKNSWKSSSLSLVIIPFDCMYMLRISYTRSGGSDKHSTITYHNFSLFTLSYALYRSINARHRGLFTWRLC
jgi:hypothetical protein